MNAKVEVIDKDVIDRSMYNQCKCCTTWVEENPDEKASVEESDECRQHAIVVRKKKKHEGNRKPLKVDSIVVHSPLLKKVLFPLKSCIDTLKF